MATVNDNLRPRVGTVIDPLALTPTLGFIEPDDAILADVKNEGASGKKDDAVSYISVLHSPDKEAAVDGGASTPVAESKGSVQTPHLPSDKAKLGEEEEQRLGDRIKGRYRRGITLGGNENDKFHAAATLERPVVTVPFFIGDYNRFKRVRDDDLE